MKRFTKQCYSLLIFATLNSATFAQDGPKSITRTTTVLEFAQECQHSGMKSQPEARIRICSSYIAGAAYQVGLTKASPACWKELEDGGFGLGPVGEVIFFLATQPKHQDQNIGEAIRWVLLEVATRNCK